MKYQKIINLLDNTSNESFKFRIKNSVGIGDDLRGRNNSNSLIKFQTSMLKSSLCDYSNPIYLLKEL